MFLSLSRPSERYYKKESVELQYMIFGESDTARNEKKSQTSANITVDILRFMWYQIRERLFNLS